jgi:hypothetical protein
VESSILSVPTCSCSPVQCSRLDTLPWYGREEGSTPSTGSTPPCTDATRVSEARCGGSIPPGGTIEAETEAETEAEAETETETETETEAETEAEAEAEAETEAETETEARDRGRGRGRWHYAHVV